MEQNAKAGLSPSQNDFKCKIHNFTPFEYLCLTCGDKPLCEKCCNEHDNKNTGHIIQDCKKIALAELDAAKNTIKLSKESKKQGKSNINLTKLMSEIREMMKKCEQDIMGAISEYSEGMKYENCEVRLEKYVGIMEKHKNEGKYVKMYQESIKFNKIKVTKENKKDSADELIKCLRKSIETLKEKLMKLEEDVKNNKKNYNQIFPAKPNIHNEIIPLEENKKEFNSFKEMVESYKENQIVKLIGNIKIDDMKKMLTNTDLSKCKMIYYCPDDDIGDEAAEILMKIINKYENIESLSITDYKISNEKR